MNSAQPGPTDDKGHGFDADMNSSATKLEVYNLERLAYTEIPANHSTPRKIADRKSALLKAMYYWSLSRS
jgi:hypothetical protein